MQSVVNFFFGKEPTPEEMVKKWRRDIGAEGRSIDRTIRGIEREENKLKMEIKKYAKANDLKTAKTLAKEIVRSRKHKDRLYVSKAQLNSVSLHLQQNLATYKMTGLIAKSADVMRAMNNLVRLPELNNVMMTMSREMEKVSVHYWSMVVNRINK
jgi:charged multivesicular body protein 3